jgi:hypothetical protein
MNGKFVLVCFLLFLPQLVTAQIYRYITQGYNTREEFNKSTGKTVYKYYIIDNDKYSNVEINGLYELYELGILYDELYAIYDAGVAVKFEFPEDDNSAWIVSLRGWVEANSFELIEGRRGLIKTIKGKNMIIFDYTNVRVKLYNTPEHEIEHKYLTLFVKNIIRIINEIYSLSIKSDGFNSSFNPEYRIREFSKDLLPNLKKQELAIMRNLLFARHNYTFQTVFWKDFMEVYYPGNYTGLNTELVVMKQFNWFEKWLLDQLIKYENDLN